MQNTEYITTRMHPLDFLKVTIHFHHSYKQRGCATVEETAVSLPNHAHSSACF